LEEWRKGTIEKKARGRGLEKWKGKERGKFLAGGLVGRG